MAPTLAASIVKFLMGMTPTATNAGPPNANRFTLEGLAFSSTASGSLDISADRFEALSLQLQVGELIANIGSIAVRKLVARVRMDAGGVRLTGFEAASAELAGITLRGPLHVPDPRTADAPEAGWVLGPLATAEGRVHAKIIDAHLLFDADVTVPLRRGQIDFDDATVEHVGPDSRMGVSRLGVYVDAPNGRSYLYQFAAPPDAGVEYERKSVLPGPWPADRGKLHLQAFGEWLLRQQAAPSPKALRTAGLTQQTRVLFDRTSVAGEIQLGNGRLSLPALQAELNNSNDGRNAVRIRSEALGRGLEIELLGFSAQDLQVALAGVSLRSAQTTGTFRFRLERDGADGQLDLAAEKLQLTHLQLMSNPGAAPSSP